MKKSTTPSIVPNVDPGKGARMSRSYAVGDTFTLVRTCDPYRPTYYAAASGGSNPIHTDPAVGLEAGPGGGSPRGLGTPGRAGGTGVSFGGAAWRPDGGPRRQRGPGLRPRPFPGSSAPIAPTDASYRSPSSPASCPTPLWSPTTTPRRRRG